MKEEIKVSKLVSHRNSLVDMNLPTEARASIDKLTYLCKGIESNPAVENADELLSALGPIQESINQLIQQHDQIYNQVEQLVSDNEPELHALSDTLFNDIQTDTAEYILGRYIPFTAKCQENLYNVLRSISDWKYPGMFIRPGNKDIVEEITSSDPFYLVDDSWELLQDAQIRFNKTYKNRCRWELLKNVDTDSESFSFVPNEQLGLTLIMDYFEYVPMRYILKLLRELFDKTRDGGTVVFTYNNCDLESGVKNVENRFRSYVPRNKMIRELNAIGWIVHKTEDFEASYSWMELKKPGELTSLRGGQSLAKVK